VRLDVPPISESTTNAHPLVEASSDDRIAATLARKILVRMVQMHYVIEDRAKSVRFGAGHDLVGA
jgi:hypothetical protein